VLHAQRSDLESRTLPVAFRGVIRTGTKTLDLLFPVAGHHHPSKEPKDLSWSVSRAKVNLNRISNPVSVDGVRECVRSIQP
jgi:hypothetical protein